MRGMCVAPILLSFVLAGCQQTPPPVGLRIGNLAPEIEGEDSDGNRFKLSDYRGKVVVLDFWAEN